MSRYLKALIHIGWPAGHAVPAFRTAGMMVNDQNNDFSFGKGKFPWKSYKITSCWEWIYFPLLLPVSSWHEMQSGDVIAFRSVLVHLPRHGWLFRNSDNLNRLAVIEWQKWVIIHGTWTRCLLLTFHTVPSDPFSGRAGCKPMHFQCRNAKETIAFNTDV